MSDLLPSPTDSPPTPDCSAKPKAFLTGMKPGQSWEDFVSSLKNKLREQGYFAPEQPEQTSNTHGNTTTTEHDRR